jgi:hypothetical protein
MQGRVSPSSWSSGSWSSGPLLSGSQSSSKGSSRVSSQVSSPSSAPSSGYQDAWDTLYAAAGEVVRLKMNEEKKVPVYSAERPSHTKVLNQALRAHIPQQTRSLAQVPGRSPPSHSARRKEENMIANNQVITMIYCLAFFSSFSFHEISARKKLLESSRRHFRNYISMSREQLFWFYVCCTADSCRLETVTDIIFIDNL